MSTLYQQLMGQNPQAQQPTNITSSQQQILKLANEYQNGEITDAQAMNSLLGLNPSFKTILNLLQGRGSMSYKDMFFLLAKQKGIDPNSILNQLSR